MKHAKKLFAVLLAVLMVASMAGCGSGGSGSGSGSNGSAEGSDGAEIGRASCRERVFRAV